MYPTKLDREKDKNNGNKTAYKRENSLSLTVVGTNWNGPVVQYRGVEISFDRETTSLEHQYYHVQFLDPPSTPILTKPATIYETDALYTYIYIYVNVDLITIN